MTRACAAGTGRRLAAVALLTAAALGASPSFALDPSRTTSQYVVRTWRVDSGLPSTSIQALAQTPDGYLWLGTNAGLVRFDGVRFVLFGAQNTPEIGDGGVSSLTVAPDGSLFLGTMLGAVTRHMDGAFERLGTPPLDGWVDSLLATREGSLWIGTLGQPLLRLAGGRYVPFSPFAGTGPWCMLEDAQGRLWLGTRGQGLARFVDGAFERLTTSDGLPSNVVRALWADARGALWVGTPKGLCRVWRGKTEIFTTRDGLSHNHVQAILGDRDGNLWVGTMAGLNRLRDGRFTHFTVRDGLCDDEVRSLLEDHEGGLWVGTADGLSRLSDSRFVSYGRREGLRETAVRTITGGADGSVWIGTTSAGVARLRAGRFEHFSAPGGLGSDSIISLYEDHARDLWICADDGRLFRLRAGKVTEHTPTNAQPPWKIPAIYEDGKALNAYVMGFGLARLGARRLVPFGENAPYMGYVYAVHKDGKGALWYGSSAGLVRLKDGAYRLFTTADGLPSNRSRWIDEDAEGRLWVATVAGLACIENGRIRGLGLREGLPEGFLRLVLDDRRGYLWIAATSSILRVAKSEVLEVLDGKRAQISPLVFDTSDGLRTTEVLFSSNPGFRASDGRLWFATAKGVSVVDPARVSIETRAPRVVIEALTVDGQRARKAEYPPGRGEVTIEFTALSFGAPGRVRFRYRLDGFDQDWVDAGTRRAAYYSNLPPRGYRFVVRASSPDGAWDGDGASVAFRLRPPFFRTPLFYTACFVLALAAAGGTYRLRVRQMRSRFAALIAERTRIARELHDTVAQSLAGVGLQIDSALRKLGADPELGGQHMRTAREMVRSSLAEVRRSIWVLRAQTSKDEAGLTSSLSDSLAQLTGDTGIEAVLTVAGRPRPLPAEVEWNLLRVAHEAVTNAVRHARPRRIVIELGFDDQAVSLRVRDDGCGFDPERSLAASRASHFGLLGMSERAHALGGTLRIDSRVGQGTEIACALPLRQRAPKADSEESDDGGARA